MEQNLERSKCEKGRSGRYTWQRNAKPKQNAKYRYGSKTTVPERTDAVKKSRSECNHHYPLASHDVLKSTMASWTWSSAFTQKGAKFVDEFRTQLIEELREEKNVRVTLERNICERENQRSKPP